jgi:TolA-binding protein
MATTMPRWHSISLTIFLVLLPVTTAFAQKQEELGVTLPPAVLFGEERMRIGDPRTPPVPTEIALGLKEEPTIDASRLRERIIGTREKTSPVTTSPGCTYSSGFGTSVARVFEGEEALYKRAKYHYHRGDYDRAWDTFENLLTHYPQSPYASSALYWMGELRWHQGRGAQAWKLYVQVVEEFPAAEFMDYALYSAGWLALTMDDPGAAHTYLSRVLRDYRDSPVRTLAVFLDGYSLLVLGQATGALELFDQVIKLEASYPYAVEAQYLRAICLFLLQRYENALTTVTEFIEAHPSHVLQESALYVKGWNLVYLRRYEDALEVFSGYLQRFPGGEWADAVRWGKVRSLLASGRVQSAEEEYRHITSQVGRSKWEDNVLYEIGIYYFDSGAYQEAVRVFRTLLQKYPETETEAAAYTRLGESLYRDGQHRAAIDAWEQLLSEFPTYAEKKEVCYWLGEASLMIGNYGKGLGYLLKTKDDPELYGRSLLAIGWYHFDHQRWAEALMPLEDLLHRQRTGPLVHRALLLKGEILFNQKEFGEALSVFQRIVTEAGVETGLASRALFYQGLTQYKRAEFSMAIEAFRYRLDQFPPGNLLAETLYWLGWSYFRQGQFPLAISTFSRLLAAAPCHRLAAKALLKIGDSYYNMEAPLKAVEPYLQVVNVFPSAPEVPEAHWGVILSFYQAGKYDNFKQWAERFLTAYPHHPTGANVLLLLGEFYRQESDLGPAVETYRRLRHIYPDLAVADEARLREAELLLQLGKLGEAEARLRDVAARKDSPYYPQALLLLGETHFERKQYGDAVRYYERLMALKDDALSEQGWFRAVNAYQAMGDPDGALRVLRSFVKRHPKSSLNADAWLMMGDIHLRAKRHNEALAAYRRVLEFERRDVKAVAHFRMGRTHIDTEDLQEALMEYLKVYYLYPDQDSVVVSALLEAGKIYLAQGQVTEADQIFRRLLSLSSAGKEADEARRLLDELEGNKGSKTATQ